jgi:hypothetical protein
MQVNHEKNSTTRHKNSISFNENTPQFNVLKDMNTNANENQSKAQN